MKTIAIIPTVFCLIISAAIIHAADWPMFRGDNGEIRFFNSLHTFQLSMCKSFEN